MIAVILCLGIVATACGQTEIKRNRGESFYHCLLSNTEGSGNIWISLSAVGHIWDDSPIKLQQAGIKHEGFWMFNTRAFPEARLQAGISEFCTATLESRPVTWAGKVPGWISGDLKFTWPNNHGLRFLGFGIDGRIVYNFTNSSPTLGGYVGFMPEGYVTKGLGVEGRFLFDVDLLSRISTLPLRIILNLGMRMPLDRLVRDYYQFLGDAGIVYSGYDYDFFAAYSIEAFNNFSEPKVFTNPGDFKRFLVWFRENPMYLILGTNVRYKNGTMLSVSIPLLLSVNVGSKMTRDDLTALNRHRDDLFPYEVAHGIKDPFDPWFVKWKIAATFSFPLRYTITSAEMTRNFLLLKNTKQQHRLDIENRLRSFEQSTTPEPADENAETEKRLDDIKKRKEELEKQD